MNLSHQLPRRLAPLALFLFLAPTLPAAAQSWVPIDCSDRSAEVAALARGAGASPAGEARERHVAEVRKAEPLHAGDALHRLPLR